ncbi:MAG: aminotransferase class V-fold PLP-dependent enzyme [Firmicutes bacterium]|nr:aminotransferase class V-fold PLP-dependent enzyme [Bacillota bacterium]
MIYLDNPATSMQKPEIVYEMMWKNTVNNSVNAGRGGHWASIRGAEGIAAAQEEIADLFNVSNPERIAFTQNATYGLNMAICGLLGREDHAVITSMEHNSVLRPVHMTCSYTIVPANERGEINPKDVEMAIRRNTKLIITTHASNVCGTVMPVEEIGRICGRHNIPYLLDTAQTAGIIPIDVEKMNVSMLAFSGHKGLMGPLGTGGLYVREGIKLHPVISGGTGTESKLRTQPETMPDMLHSGTMNTPAIMTLGEAVKFVKRHGIKGIWDKERALAEVLIDRLMNINGVTVYGLPNGNRNGTVAFNIGDMDSQEAANVLNSEYSIATRGGYHCSYIAHQTIGSEKSGAVRVGFGFFSNKSELERLAYAVNRIAKIRE